MPGARDVGTTAGTAGGSAALGRVARHWKNAAAVVVLSGAITTPRFEDLRVTPSGARHSMGGQAFTPNGLAIDMRGLTDLSLDEDRRTSTVGIR